MDQTEINRNILLHLQHLGAQMTDIRNKQQEDENYRMMQTPAPAARPSASLPLPQENSELNGRPLRRDTIFGQEAGDNVIRVERRVPEDQKISKLTYRGMILAKRSLEEFKSTYADQSKTLQHFLSENVLLLLIENEQRLQTPHSENLSIAMIYKVSELTMIDMICRYLRPVTTEEYYTQVLESVDMPVPMEKSWTFGIAGYDKALHAAVAKTILQARKLVALVYYNARTTDMSLWPKDLWGHKTRPGTLRCFLKVFGKFEEFFIEKITEDVLKTYTSLEQVFAAIERTNNELCTAAKALKVSQSQFTKPPDLNTFVEDFKSRAKDSSLQSGFNAGKQYNRQGDGTPLGTPSHHSRPDARGNSNTGDTRYARPDHRPQGMESSSRFGRPDMRAQGNTPARSPPFSRYNALEDVSSPDDKSSLRQVAPEEEDEPVGLLTLLGSPASKTLYPGKVSPRAHPSTLPCFKYAKGQCDDKHCTYSHDQVVLKAFMYKRLEDIDNTLGSAWIQMQLDKMLQLRRQDPGPKKQPSNAHSTPRYMDAPVRAMDAFEEEVDGKLSVVAPYSEAQARIDEDADLADAGSTAPEYTT